MKTKLLLLTSFCLFLFVGQAQTFDHVETFTGFTGDGNFTSSDSGIDIDWTATNTNTPAVVLIAQGQTKGTLVSGSIESSVANIEIDLSSANGSPALTVTISNGTPQQFSLSGLANETIRIGGLNSSGPFTISLENTGNKNISINSIKWNEYSGSSTIYDIQYTDEPGVDGTYPSLEEGKTYSVFGVVTSVKFGAGYYIQSVDGSLDGSSNLSDWSAIYIDDAFSTTIAVQDDVTVTGKVVENNGRTEILMSSVVDNGPTDAVTPNMIYSALEEKDESVLSFVTYSRYGSGASGNFIMNIGFSTPVISVSVDNDLYTYPDPLLASHHYKVHGPVNYGASTFKISPRDVSDVLDEGLATNNEKNGISTDAVYSHNKSIIAIHGRPYSMEVYNLAGQKVKGLSGVEGRTEINMEKGVYIVRLQSENTSLTEKVLVK